MSAVRGGESAATLQPEKKNSKPYELAAGLVLPGVFGAELVFLFQMLTRDLALGYEGQSLPWLLKYLFGAWFVLYVCTSFVVTVAHADRAEYGGINCVTDFAEAVFSFAALGVLGFVDAEVTHSAFRAQPELPLGYAFLSIMLIALLGALGSHGPRSRWVIVARWIGGVIGVLAGGYLLLNGYRGPFVGPRVILIVASTALFGCYLSLLSYLVGRWRGPD